ncbi:MAG: hypothetical protein JNK49_19520 [Planctomycetes bacterium]|nr:hypothetical protein [Planctomycetota bacterium]
MRSLHRHLAALAAACCAVAALQVPAVGSAPLLRSDAILRPGVSTDWGVDAGVAAGAARATGRPQDPPAPQGQGQANAPRVTVDPATDSVVISMNETNGIELLEFIKWAQELTGRTFIMPSEQDLQTAGPNGGRISFLGPLRLKRDRWREEFYTFFQTMLYVRGFAVLPRGEGNLEMLEIVHQAGPRQKEISSAARYVTPDELPKYRSQAGVPILTTVQLKHINALGAQNALRPFFAQSGTPTGSGGVVLGGVGNNTSMLLSGYGPQVYAAVELLRLADVPVEQPNLVVQVVPLEETAPEELEPILNDVLESRNKIRQAVLQEQGGGQGGGAAAASNQPQLKIVVNSNQRALILSGTPEQVSDAKELIAKLDLKSLQVEGTASVIRLKNVLAKDLRTTLNTFMQDDNQAEQQAQQGQGAGASAVRRTRRTVINDHAESNSLLISAAQTKYKNIVALIDQLDRRQPQVLIEAALVELTTGDLMRFGIELGAIDIKDDGDFTRPFGFSHFGQSTFKDTDGDSLPDTRLPDFNAPLQGLTGGILTGGDFAMPILINALATDQSANILSLPSVLVNNNETAVVKTEEERPTQTQNQGTATTQSGVGQPRKAGITLEISPSISPNNYLRLNISLEVSRFVGSFDPDSVTGGGIVLRRNMKTQVTMPSNATMVLGGVIEDSESYADSGIPFLKDIPLLGFLFRRSEKTTNKTNLYFFVTPSILDEDDFQDLYHVSLQRKLEAQDYIGERRLRIIDRKWTSTAAAQARTLADTGATIENLDQQGGFDMPFYERSRRLDVKPAPKDRLPKDDPTQESRSNSAQPQQTGAPQQTGQPQQTGAPLQPGSNPR